MSSDNVDNVRAKNSELIKQYKDEINLHTLKSLKGVNDVESTILNGTRVNEYKTMLEKARSKYTQIKLTQLFSKAKMYSIPLIITFGAYQFVKYYYIIYYYIMWDIDIRKPRVSDYIIERYR
jgi:hypothetical protein